MLLKEGGEAKYKNTLKVLLKALVVTFFKKLEVTRVGRINSTLVKILNINYETLSIVHSIDLSHSFIYLVPFIDPPPY